MRSTLRLDEQLLAEVRKRAAESGKALATVIEEALRESLARRRTHPTEKRVRLKTVKGSGVRPGVGAWMTAQPCST